MNQYDRPFERDPYADPTLVWHRCDVRWHMDTAKGTLYAESPTSMYFRFFSRVQRQIACRALYARWIPFTKFSNGILVVHVPALEPGECDECDNVERTDADPVEDQEAFDAAAEA